MLPISCQGVSLSFQDVWSSLGDLCGYIQLAADQGIINTRIASPIGSPDKFYPNAPITRAAFVDTIVKSFDVQYPEFIVDDSTYSFYTDISSTLVQANSINRLATTGCLNTRNTMFRPAANISRGEAFKIMSCLIKKKQDDNIGESQSNTNSSMVVSSGTTTFPIITNTTGASALAYVWVTWSYGVCSKTCGEGIQTRTISCKNTTSGQIVSETYCQATRIVKPVSQKLCNLQACTLSGINTREDTSVTCQQDTKKCADGTYVSRVAPSCDFAPCSNANSSQGVINNSPFYKGNLVVNATCGSAAGKTHTTAPYSNLCEAGTPTQMTINWQYKWSCVWTKGEVISCSAWMSNWVVSDADGVCGEANGKTYDAPPSVDKLCQSGNPESLEGVWPWTWVCAWPRSAKCLAYKNTPQPTCQNVTADNIGNTVTIHKADWSRQDKWTDAVGDENSCDYASFESHFYRSGNWCIATVSPWETHAYEFTNGLYPAINISTEAAYHGVEISLSECPGDFDTAICKPRSSIAGYIRSNIFWSDCWKIELGKRYYFNIRKPSTNGGADGVQVTNYNTTWKITSYSFQPKEQKQDPTDTNGKRFSQTKSWTGTLNKDGVYIFPFVLSSYNQTLAIKSGTSNSSKYITYSISENPGDFEYALKAGYRVDLWSGFTNAFKFWNEWWQVQTPTYGQIKAELGKQYYLNMKVQYEWSTPNYENTNPISIYLR